MKAEEIRGEVILKATRLSENDINVWNADELKIKILTPLGKVEKSVTTPQATGIRNVFPAIYLRKQLGRVVRKGETFSFAIWLGPSTENAPDSFEITSHPNAMKYAYPGQATVQISFKPESQQIDITPDTVR